MYAIVDIAGQQYKVEKDQKVFVNRLEGDEGSKVDFDQVLLVDDNGKVQVGAPVVKNMLVSASIVSHLKEDTVKVFKKKRRKGYQVLNGHRQQLTELLIEGIGAGTVKAPAAKKEEPKKQATPKKATPKAKASSEEAKPKAAPKAKAATKPKTEAKPKAPAKKKETAAKKPAAKKPAAKKTASEGTAAKSAPKAKAAPKAKKADDKKSEE